jgi:signal transduction histidine kinase
MRSPAFLIHLLRQRGRNRLVRQYFIVFFLLISGGLITSGLLELFYSYHDINSHISLIQSEIARGAAMKIAQFILTIEAQMKTATISNVIARKGIGEEYQFELARLLLVAPAITEVFAIDEGGRPRAYLSRFRVTPREDELSFSARASFVQARQGITFFGTVTFDQETEPTMTIAVPIEQFPGKVIGVLRAQVDLGQIWEVVRDIKFSDAGYAYISTRSGDLIAHSNPGLVLQRPRTAHLPQLQTAFQPNPVVPAPESRLAHDLTGRRVLSSFAYLPGLDWAVFVEQPLSDAFKTLYDSTLRTSALLLVGLGIALLASGYVARRVVLPLELLRRGVEQIGSGDPHYQLQIKTGDEIELLAEEFNLMAARLRASLAELERNVEDRTVELRTTLEQKSAIAEVLRVMARSPKDVHPVLNAMIANAVRLVASTRGMIYTFDGEVLRAAAHENLSSAGMKIVNEPVKLDEQGAVAVAFRSREVVHVPDIEADPQHSGRASITGTSTILAVPLFLAEECIGVILLLRDLVQPFTQAEIELARTFGDQAGIAIGSVRMFQELQSQSGALAKSVEELKALGKVSQSIGSTLDLQAVLSNVVLQAVSLSGADSGAICEFNEHSHEFLLRATRGLSDELVKAIEEVQIPLEGTVLGRTVATGEPTEIADLLQAPDYPLREVLGRMGMRALLGVPLVRETQIIGALIVGRKSPGSFPRKTVDLLRTFASQSALAIHNARLFRELEIVNDRLRELDKMKSQFVANVSHELRTPLSAIEGLADNMLHGITGELNPKQVDYVTEVKASADRLARLIDDILDLSTIERGGVELRPASLSVAALVQDVVGGLRTMAHEKQIALEIAPIAMNLSAWADRDKIAQVLTNLIGNAVKFSPQHSKVTVGAHQNGGQWLEISVADTGPGIAPEERGNIFDEFYQVTRRGKEKTKGVGLGLAISKKLIDMHGGKLWMESEAGKGSVFYFTLPAQPPESEQSAHA